MLYLARKLWQNKVATAALAILVLLLLFAVGARLTGLPDPNQKELIDKMMPPAWAEKGELRHLLGTDHQGRDTLSRLLYGARVSFGISLGATAITTIVGVTLGLVSGYFRRLDGIIMRLADIQLSIPSLMLAIALAAALGHSNITNLVLVLAITGWVEYTRVVRGVVLGLREREYVEAARALGARSGRILFRHILPQLGTPVIVLATVQISRFMLVESGLSYLGLGVPPQYPSWGGMLHDAQKYIFQTWYPALFPGLALSLAVLSLNLFGDWLAEILDPQLRRVR